MTDTITQAEQALIGAMLIDPAVLDTVAVSANEFRHPLAKACWLAASRLREDRKPIDPVTLESALEEALRGPSRAFLIDCIVTTPTASNADHYADIVRDEALRRRVLIAVSDVLAGAAEMTGHDLLQRAQDAVTNIDAGSALDGGVSMRESVRQRFDEYGRMAEARERGDITVTGLPTGLEALDKIIGGLQPGIVTIVCGRPGMGKSALSLGFAGHCAARELGVHVFSLEDSRDAYTDRAVSRLSMVPVTKIRGGGLNQNDMDGLRVANRQISAIQGWLIDERSNLTAADVIRSVRRRKAENRTRLVVVDYLQLMKHPRAERYDLRVAETVKQFQSAAKADGMAYVILSQLNRGNKERRDKRPVLSDLRDAGQIEEYAKCVIAVYRGAYHGDPVMGVDYEKGEYVPTGNEWEQRIELLVLKNSNGETGTVVARWDGETTRVH